MTVHVQPPTLYRHWTGRRGDTGLAGDWIQPRMYQATERAGGSWWTELPDMDDWTHLGWAPVPDSRWRRFWHQIHHGRLMQFPWPSVLAFAVRDLITRAWGGR